jgi:two-component system, NtrC family, sensor histidine kinase KinB
MLRTRLYLGLLPILLTLIAVGLYGVVLFSQQAALIDRLVGENYRSTLAAQEMKQALAGMNTGLILASRNNYEMGVNFFEVNRAIFAKNLETQNDSLTALGGESLGRFLRTEFSELIGEGEAFLQRTRTESGGFIEPPHEVIFQLAEKIAELQRLNQEALVAAGFQAREQGIKSIQLLLVAMVAGLALSLIASYRLGRAIIEPIDSLKASTREIAAGNLDLKIQKAPRDEIGELVRDFADMTDKLRAYRQSTTHQVIRAQKTMEATLFTLPDPVFVLNDQREFEMINPAAERLLKGIDHREVFDEFLDTRVRPVLETQRSYTPQDFGEALALKADGVERFYLPRILLIQDERFRLFGAAVLLQDITRLRLADDLKTNLIATVSHELKTPLTGLRMAVHMLLEPKLGALNPDQQELVTTARSETERLLRILNDLLDLAKLESGAFRLTVRPMRVQDLIDEAIAELRDRLRQTDHRVRLAVACPDDEALVDRDRIRHVFTNLIGNAMKYSPTGSEILVYARREGFGKIRFGVKDRGIGIAADHAPRIFDKCYRVPGSTQSGSGLGLAIVREIVVAHGGAIECSSDHGRGSDFNFTLPVALADRERYAPTEEEALKE